MHTICEVESISKHTTPSGPVRPENKMAAISVSRWVEEPLGMVFYWIRGEKWKRHRNLWWPTSHLCTMHRIHKSSHKTRASVFVWEACPQHRSMKITTMTTATWHTEGRSEVVGTKLWEVVNFCHWKNLKCVSKSGNKAWAKNRCVFCFPTGQESEGLSKKAPSDNTGNESETSLRKQRKQVLKDVVLPDFGETISAPRTQDSVAWWLFQWFLFCFQKTRHVWGFLWL